MNEDVKTISSSNLLTFTLTHPTHPNENDNKLCQVTHPSGVHIFIDSPFGYYAAAVFTSRPQLLLPHRELLAKRIPHLTIRTKRIKNFSQSTAVKYYQKFKGHDVTIRFMYTQMNEKAHNYTYI